MWIISFGIVFLLPGFMSINMNSLRIIQILPLLLVVTAYGSGVLLQPLAGRARVLLMTLLFLFSTVFDMARLSQPYREVDSHPELFQATGKSLARYRAYQTIQEQAKRLGPGWVLGEWDVPSDRTLEVMTYNFNALKGNTVSAPAWLAILTDAHYLPFLKARFPEGEWRMLDADVHPESPRLLGLFHITRSNRDALTRWAQADSSFNLINWDLDHLHDRGVLERFDQDVQKGSEAIQGDPFIASMYWEKVGSTYYYFGNHYPQHLEAMERAVKEGYPASHLYGELATLYWVGGNQKAAEEVAMKAKASDAKYPWH